jgi:sugar phosphate isomerase/epimerase
MRGQRARSDWHGLIQALREIGYDGALSLDLGTYEDPHGRSPHNRRRTPRCDANRAAQSRFLGDLDP